MWIWWRSIRRYWAELILSGIGLFAVAILIAFPVHRSLILEANCEDEPHAWRRREELPTGNNFAHRAIEEMGPRAIPVIFGRVPTEGPFHFDTVLALSQLGPAAVPGLVEGFRHPQAEVRLVAIRALACLAPRLGSQAGMILPKLVRLLRDPNEEVRFGTVLLLGRIPSGKQEAVPGLISLLQESEVSLDDSPAYIRQGAAYLLGKIGPAAEAAVPELERLLQDPQPSAQQEAAIALWRITGKTNTLVPQLTRLMQANDRIVREQAATALARISQVQRPGH